MCLLVETIKVGNGKVFNISFHNERMIRTLYQIYGISQKINLESIINVPESAESGVYKCRVIYDNKSVKTEFLPYIKRNVKSIKIIKSDNICYPYKYTDRTRLNSLFEMRGECDEILIAKNGKVTDSSYSNLVFKDFHGKWITPKTYLLPGTRRAALLKNGLICEADISIDDIIKYKEVKLINSMIGIEDSEGIPVSEIIF
jgi:4-amino-4-deoxychorismate lyase